MHTPNLIGISGLELRWVREQAGWSRARMARVFRSTNNGRNYGRGLRGLTNLEVLATVAPLAAQQYRALIGNAVFDELLTQARKASASGKLDGIIKRGRSWKIDPIADRRTRSTENTIPEQPEHNGSSEYNDPSTSSIGGIGKD